MVVAFAFSGSGGWDCLEKPGDLLVGGICLSIEYQDRYVNLLEGFGRQSIRDRTANDGSQHFRINSRDPSRNEVRRGEMPGNEFPLLQNSCPLLCPHPSGERPTPPALRDSQRFDFI